mgnify:CR=1 FL=1
MGPGSFSTFDRLDRMLEPNALLPDRLELAVQISHCHTHTHTRACVISISIIVLDHEAPSPQRWRNLRDLASCCSLVTSCPSDDSMSRLRCCNSRSLRSSSRNSSSICNCRVQSNQSSIQSNQRCMCLRAHIHHARQRTRRLKVSSTSTTSDCRVLVRSSRRRDTFSRDTT